MEPRESGLFVSVLACAATIEFLSAVECPNVENGRIARWLEANIPEFREQFDGKTLAEFFETRYRHHVAHKAYVSLGRLGDIDEIVHCNGRAVTVNPFRLSRELRSWLDRYSAELPTGRRDQRAFCHVLRGLFEPEVQLAIEEEAVA